MNKTKIIATLGPACCSKEKISDLILAGVDVFRINMSHADFDSAKESIKLIREVNEELDTFVATLIDTKGPEIRIGEIENGKIHLKKDDFIWISNEEILGSEKVISTSYDELSDDVKIGNKVLINDGKMELEVVAKDSSGIKCIAKTEGLIETRKNVHIPGATINMKFMSETDRKTIKFASEQNVDFLAASFIRNNVDVLDINDLLIGLNNDHMQIIAKIENACALDNLEAIIKTADGVMVARGDLGVEMELEKLPGIQKRIINKAKAENKIAIVATEMLATMQENNRPTRAEVSDVANAVLDGADAVMLSGETAIGNYPVKAVETMNKIIEEIESEINYVLLLDDLKRKDHQDITSVIAHNVADSANQLRAKAIVATTMSGYTAKIVSKFRPSCPIIATSPNLDVVLSLALNWGIIPVLVKEYETTEQIVKNSIKIAKKKMDLKKYDKIIITGGFPLKKIKYTNFMRIEEIIDEDEE